MLGMFATAFMLTKEMGRSIGRKNSAFVRQSLLDRDWTEVVPWALRETRASDKCVLVEAIVGPAEKEFQEPELQRTSNRGAIRCLVLELLS